MCGPTEIDGYAFCLGVDSMKLYKADPDLQSLIDSITYLIKGAIFRPGYSMSLGRCSLDICPLGELIDMYHTHEATQRHDKVYALLGMSSDDLSKACLSPNYRVSWEELFQDLVRFLLYPEISVETLGHKQTALVKSKGCILGTVSLLQNDIASNDSQSKEVIFKNTSSQPECTTGPGWGWSTHWTPHHSAKSIRDDDLVCILQGASKPTIIRLCNDHFDIIMIGANYPEKILELSQSIKAFPRHFLLLWDWEKPPEELRGEGTCGAWLRRNNGASEHSKTKFEGNLEEATRLWNIAMILEDSKDSFAECIIQEVVEQYEIAAKSGYDEILKQQLVTRLIDIDAKSKEGRTVLSWAAGEGNESAVKLLVEMGKADINAKDGKGRTPLSWAAGEGHEGTVKLLVETGKADIDTADQEGRTALSHAAIGGKEGVVRVLIETGEADISSKDLWGRTPLRRAIEGPHEGTVKLLVETGKADIDAKDKIGFTALSWATQYGDEGILKLLVEAGAAVTGTRNVDQL
jgi:ankyrin repeat protein